MSDCSRSPRTRVGAQPVPKGARLQVAYLAAITGIAIMLIAGHAAGHYPAIPLEQVADVIVVIKPRDRQSLHLPATVDRIIQGNIVRVEKGVPPIVIVHTRNTFGGAPLEAGVPVRLYLKAFKDGHAHYIIGVSSAPSGSQP